MTLFPQSRVLGVTEIIVITTEQMHTYGPSDRSVTGIYNKIILKNKGELTPP